MSERHDFYGPIHKGLRLGSTRLLTALGCVDWSDARASGELLEQLRAHLVLAAKHLDHEDGEINVILRDRTPGLATRLDHEHDDHRADFEDLDRVIAEVDRAEGDERRRAGHRLYLRFSRHMGEDFLHMAREEEEALPRLQDMFDDAELEAIHNRIKASIPLDRLVAYFKLILAAASPQERVMLMSDMRSGAPTEVYQAVEAGVQDGLPAGEWDALRLALTGLREAA
jgi:hypothetical protein